MILSQLCYVERGLFDKRVTLPVGERMCGFPRLEEEECEGKKCMIIHA